MIAIIDYGVGNLYSLSSSLKYLGLESVVTGKAQDLENADRIILPGVGAFGDAIGKFRGTGLVPVLDTQVAAGKPLLGICLGMQLLFDKSYEYGKFEGLGYIHGDICPLLDDFAASGLKLKVPHMGWNSLNISRPEHPLMKNTKQGDFVYFVHSFYAKNCEDAVVATADYGISVPGVVGRENVCGCQFHPEKSGKMGLLILKAFSQM